jgi:uncharacterized membrane protein YfhO
MSKKSTKTNKINFDKFKPRNPLPAIGEFFRTQPHIWLSFLIPFCITFAAYMYFGVWPRGEKSVLALDFNAQYVYYFAYMRDALFSGESILYSWSRNLSGEFVGIIGYYLFSPFNLIVWIFPLAYITEGLLLMMLTKIGFIGVTMAVYLSYSRGFAKHTTVMFSMMYALLSYNIVQTMNPMWLDGVMALPLVCMGIESLLKNGKYKLLIFALVYSFLCCFYIGFMIAIFAALYYVYYALTSRKLDTKGNWAVLGKRSVLFATVAVISVCLSAFILLPVYSALSMGKLEFSNPDFGIRNQYDILNITKKLFVNSYDTVRMPEGMPFLFSGTLSLILFPLYFFCDRIRRVRRFGGVALITALIVSMFITPIDMLWHGGQAPNWLPYRYSFMVCFLIIAFAAEAFEHIRKIPHKTIGMSAIFFVTLAVFWQYQDTVVPALSNNSGRDVFPWFETAFAAIMLIMIFAGLLYLGRDKLNKHNMLTCVIIAVVALELLYNTRMSFEKQHTDIHYSSRESFHSMVVTRKVMDGIIAKDDGFFRSGKTYIRSACDDMALRMKGVTHSSSMLNDRVIDILKNLGYQSRSHASRYSGATPLTDDLFGFKYILSVNGNNHSNVKTVDDVMVYENHDVLPIAYLTDSSILSFLFEGDNVFTNQNKLLSYMLERNVSTVFADDISHYNIRTLDGNYSIFNKTNPHEDGYIDYSSSAHATGHYYAYLPSSYMSDYTLSVIDKTSPTSPTSYPTSPTVLTAPTTEPTAPTTVPTTVPTEPTAPTESTEQPQETGKIRGRLVEQVGDSGVYYLGYFEEDERFTVSVALAGQRIFLQDVMFKHANTATAALLGDEMNHSALISLLTGGDSGEHFTIVSDVEPSPVNLQRLSEGYSIYTRTGDGAYIEYELSIERAGQYFAHFPGDYERMYDIYVNDAPLNLLYNATRTHAYYIGDFEAGAQVRVRLVLNQNEIFFSGEHFARANPDLLRFEGEAAERYYSRILSYMKTVDNDNGNFLAEITPADERRNNVTFNEENDRDHVSYTRSSDGAASVVYTLSADGAGEYFAYFPTDYNPNFTLLVNGARVANVFTDNLHAHYLGHFEAGEQFEVTLAFLEEENVSSVHFKRALFARPVINFEYEAVLRNQERVASYFKSAHGEISVNEYFKRVFPYETLPQNVQHEGLGEGYMGYARIEGSQGDAHIEYFFNVEADGEMYMYFPSTYERKCNLWVAKLDDRGHWSPGEFKGQVYETDHHHIHHLGFFRRGETVKVTLSLQPGTDKVFFREEVFVRLDKDLLEADVASIHQTNENSVFRAVSNRHLRVDTNHPNEMVLFTTIPNEPGWRVTVNGKRAEILDVLDPRPGVDSSSGLIAVRVPAGENRVELKFFPSGMRIGIALFFVGIAGLVALNWFMKKYAVTERAIAARQAGSAKGRKKRSRILSDVRDIYDGFDTDYVNIDPEDDDEFDFEEAADE